MVECVLHTDEVAGSNPASPTLKTPASAGVFSFFYAVFENLLKWELRGDSPLNGVFMARPPLKIHELRITKKAKGAYVNYLGKKHYLGTWDDKKDEPSANAVERFEQLKAHWRADPDGGVAPRAKGMLLVELWAKWLSSSESPRTSPEVVKRAHRYLFGKGEERGPHTITLVEAFDGKMLQAWQAFLCNLCDGEKLRLSRDSVSRCVRLLRGCFDWGLIQGLVKHEQVHQLSIVPPPQSGTVRENTKRKAVPRQLVDAVLPFLSPPLRATVELMWLTCARPSEMLGLKAGDVLRSGKMMTPGGVVLDLDELRVWTAIKEEHKTDDTDFERVLFFGPKAQAILEPLLVGRTAVDFVFRPADGRAYSTAAKAAKRTPTGKGSRKPVKGTKGKRQPSECYTYGKLATAVKRACKRATIRPWTPYQLRHTAFRLVQAEFGRDAARVFGGHKVGGATENYAGSDLNTAARVALAMG